MKQKHVDLFLSFFGHFAFYVMPWTTPKLELDEFGIIIPHGHMTVVAALWSYA